MTIWSFVEQEMPLLCRHDIRRQKGFGVPTDGAEARPRTVAHCTDYWQDQGGSTPPSWQEVDNIRDMRNQIAHENSRRNVSVRSKRVDAYVGTRHVAGKESLLFEGDNLVGTTGFCREFRVESTGTFFRELFRMLP